MTHPFHPLAHQAVTWIADRKNMQGRRLLCRTPDGEVWSIPVEWTDQVTPNLEFELGDGRAVVLFADAMALSQTIDRILGREEP